MLAKILGAIAGEKLAGRDNKTKGALIGAAAPIVAKRIFGPLGLALAAGYGIKKLNDYRKANQASA